MGSLTEGSSLEYGASVILDSDSILESYPLDLIK